MFTENNLVLRLTNFTAAARLSIMKEKTMLNKIIIQLIPCIIILLAAVHQSSGLEQLSEDEMDSLSGQFGSVVMDPLMSSYLKSNPEKFIGLSIFTSPILVSQTKDSLRFTPSTGYVQFDDVISSVKIGNILNYGGMNLPIKFGAYGIDEPDTLFTDTWPTGYQDYYIENPLNGKAVTYMDADQSVVTFNFDSPNMILNDQGLGRFNIADFTFTETRAELLTLDGLPNFLFHTQINNAWIRFYHDDQAGQPDGKNSLQIKKLMLGETFNDTLPSYLSTVSPGDEFNPDDWTVSGTIKVGTGNRTPLLSFEDDPLIQQDAPTASIDPYAYASIDIQGDTAPYIRHRYYIRTDSGLNMDTIYEVDPDGYVGDGVTYPYVDNPRLNKGYVKARVPLEGSIRAAHITDYGPKDTGTNDWGDVDVGPVAVDGIRSITNVEAPGYGYGNTWNSLPYDESKYE